MEEELFKRLLTWLEAHQNETGVFANNLYAQVPQETANVAMWAFCHGLLLRKSVDLANEFGLSLDVAAKQANRAIEAHVKKRTLEHFKKMLDEKPPENPENS